MPAAAICTDESDEKVTQAAVQWGRINQGKSYSCKNGRKDGACILPVAAQFCPETCGLCSTSCSSACGTLCLLSRCSEAGAPRPWTLLRSSKHFCIATQQRCDPSTKCGDALSSSGACERAARELGLGNVTILHVGRAPAGCFVDTSNRTYFNRDGIATSSFNFVKSVCQLQTLPDSSGQPDSCIHFLQGHEM